MVPQSDKVIEEKVIFFLSLEHCVEVVGRIS